MSPITVVAYVGVAGFACIYGAQTTIPADDVVPPWLVTAFGIMCALMLVVLVAFILLLALMTVSVLAIDDDSVDSAAARWCVNFAPYWRWATRCMLLSGFLFLGCTALAGFVQFYRVSPVTAYSIAAIVGVSLLLAARPVYMFACDFL